MIRCNNISAGYGAKKVLENLSFELSEGENLVILGENGVGKSTLAKVLTGMVEAEGEIRIAGRVSREIPGRKRALLINYVPPKLESFETAITLKEFVMMGRFPYKGRFEPYHDEEAGEADALLAELGLEGCGGKRISELSSGQQQLALIAQAAMQQSAVTIFDEPVANVDIGRIRRVFGIIKNSSRFKSKIVITHDLNFAQRLGYRVLFLKEGRAIFDGSAAEFFADDSLAKHFGPAVRRTEKGIVVEYV
jgi:iron complex transport system ATP-binding protein